MSEHPADQIPPEPYDGPERRKGRQSAFDKLLHSVWGVLSIMGGVAVLSAGTALSAQRFIGAPAANAKAITEILEEHGAFDVRITVNEDDIVVLKARDQAMELQHVGITASVDSLRAETQRSVQRLGTIICASLGEPTREVRIACAALKNGD